jgi:hypothetical protein
VRVADPGSVDERRLSRLVASSKPAHLPHRVEVLPLDDGSSGGADGPGPDGPGADSGGAGGEAWAAGEVAASEAAAAFHPSATPWREEPASGEGIDGGPAAGEEIYGGPLTPRRPAEPGEEPAVVELSGVALRPEEEIAEDEPELSLLPPEAEEPEEPGT